MVNPSKQPSSGRDNSQSNVSEVQLKYAAFLHWVALIGLIFLVVGFSLYVFGILPPLVEPERVTEMWHMEAEEYIEANNLPTGWSWLYHIGNGDIVTFSSLIFLALGTIICLLPTLVLFLKNRDLLYALFVFLELVVLILAATGILIGSH